MRALGAFPIIRSNQDLAVFLAFLAMKLVNRHGANIAGTFEQLNRLGRHRPYGGFRYPH